MRAVGHFGEENAGTFVVAQPHDVVVRALDILGTVKCIGVQADRAAQNLRANMLFCVVDDVQPAVTDRV